MTNTVRLTDQGLPREPHRQFLGEPNLFDNVIIQVIDLLLRPSITWRFEPLTKWQKRYLRFVYEPWSRFVSSANQAER